MKKERDSTLLELRTGALPAGRSRSAPEARETSDVSRFRGLVLAGAVGAAALVAAVSATAGGAAFRSPGPVSRSHERAAVECETCHSSEPLAKACTGCHGAHASTRAGHRELRAEGTLGCPTCHAAHSAERLVFEPDGSVVRHAFGAEQRLDLGFSFRPASETTVPVIRARACSGCHDMAAATDPISRCLLADQASLLAERPIVCFDEHRRIAAPGGSTARVGRVEPERDAAWEAALSTLAQSPAPPVRATLAKPVGWLGTGLGAAFIALVITRALERRRARRRARSAPEPMKAADVVRLPQINPVTCIGCYACVDACPYDVLEVERYVAVVARPDACCGLTLCEQRCPNGSLVIRDGEAALDRPRVSASLESVDVPGLYVAGDLTGAALIRNAINQGAQAVREVKASLGKKPRATPELCDLVIVGAGPAGISAALEAKSAGLDYRVVEQGSVAESIHSFPRGKLVFDQPLGMPLVGELWLDECTKEDLLSKWLRVVRREKLSIDEQTRVVGIERVEGGPPLGAFEIRALSDERPKLLRARRVLLAIGRRGSPRKLAVAIPDSMLNRVHYSLADARSFANMRVVIVGLGDVAMESAIALARQPGSEVSVVYRGDGFRRGRSRNIDELKRLIAAGRVTLERQSVVKEVDEGVLVVSGPQGERRLSCDSLFVMIGSIAPWELLLGAGLKRPS